MKVDLKLTKLLLFDKDVKEFHRQTGWYFDELKPKISTVSKYSSYRTSDSFVKKFPILSNLLKKARVVEIHFPLFSWHLIAWTSSKQSCGWLVRKKDADMNTNELLPAHALLLEEMGNIECAFNAPKNSPLTIWDQFFIRGNTLAQLVERRHMHLSSDQKHLLNHQQLRCFDSKSRYFYDTFTGELTYFRKKYTSKEQTPENRTVYQLDLDIPKSSFIEFVEGIAQDWWSYQS